MKKIYTILIAVLITASVFAQAPEKMSYQSVIRNTSDQLVTNQGIGMQISILRGSATTGTVVYVETHNTSTNANGLVTVEIGNGTVESGDFTTIEWANDIYFIKTETDPTTAGGTIYTITGTSQLMSVAYALHAKTAETITSGINETDPTFTSSEANNITATDITNLSNLSGTNTGDQDISGIATNQQTIQDTASQIRADFPDVSGFVSTETDPIYNVWDKTTGITISESQITDLSHFTNTDETDPVFGASVASGITGTDTTNWNNKLDSYAETDPEFTSWDKSTGISITESQISDLDHFTNTDETDPTYTSSQAANITATDITNLGNLSGTNTGDQTISRTGLIVTLTNGGTYQDSVNVYTAGDGIDITGTTISEHKYQVGDFAQGGIVFWLDETGEHGLVCTKENQNGGLSLRWYAGTNGNTQAKGDGPYAGEANTAIIIAAHVAIGDDGNNYAARICNELQITEAGKSYGDWYLPSKKELNLMFLNKTKIDSTALANGGVAIYNGETYTCSTEYNDGTVWQQEFTNGMQSIYSKYKNRRFRAVRAF